MRHRHGRDRRRPLQAAGRQDRGQASLELALCLPLVLMFMLLFVQVAVVVRDQLAVQAAARDGARAASAAAGTAAATRAARSTTGLQPLGVTVAQSQQAVTVTVRYVQRTTVPIVGPLLPNITLTATATMVLEPP